MRFPQPQGHRELAAEPSDLSPPRAPCSQHHVATRAREHIPAPPPMSASPHGLPAASFTRGDSELQLQELEFSGSRAGAGLALLHPCPPPPRLLSHRGAWAPAVPAGHSYQSAHGGLPKSHPSQRPFPTLDIRPPPSATSAPRPVVLGPSVPLFPVTAPTFPTLVHW